MTIQAETVATLEYKKKGTSQYDMQTGIWVLRIQIMAAEPPPYQVNPSVTDLGHEYQGENRNYITSKQAAGDNNQQGTIQTPIEKCGVIEPPAVLDYPLQSEYPQQPPSYQLPYHMPTGPSAPPPSYYGAGSNTVRH